MRRETNHLCQSKDSVTDHGDSAPATRKNTHMDATAKRIIEQLQQDGRRSYAAIGKAVGLSEAAVSQRVQSLVEAGVVQVVGVTGTVMLGVSRLAMIAVS